MSSQPAARARPVADAPVDALLAQADELARRWALALIATRPLQEIAELPLGDLARSGPALCAALVRALASGEALARLTGGVAVAPAVGTRSAGELVGDIDTLRSILWDATLQQLNDPPTRLVADLADRLSYVCATAIAAILEAPAETAGVPATARVAAGPPRQPARAYDAAATRPPPHVTERHVSERRVAVSGGATLIDEFGQEPRPLAPSDELEGGRPRAAREGAAPIANAPGEGREPTGPGVERDAGAPPGGRPASPGSPPSLPPQPPRTTPRPRPWDTPLGDEPTLRVRRGRDARIDNGG
ncbi:MAG TPA: hypothetical protein VGH09_11870 [Solirubrobacteraceae bacterium]|jgi:hypothetical protein